jgi:hypothetical protein
MITDKKWYFQDGVGSAGDDISATTTAAISSKSIDTRKVYSTTLDIPGQGFADGGGELYLYVRCKTLGVTSIETISLEDFLDDSTYANVETKTVPSALNLADSIVCRLRLPMGLRRFIRVTITNTTSGTNVYNAWIATS